MLTHILGSSTRIVHDAVVDVSVYPSLDAMQLNAPINKLIWQFAYYPPEYYHAKTMTHQDWQIVLCNIPEPRVRPEWLCDSSVATSNASVQDQVSEFETDAMYYP